MMCFLNNDNYFFSNSISIQLNDASKLNFLYTFLQDNTTVDSVFLEGNQIGDEGAKTIAKALKINQTVTYINLSRCGISDKGAQAIAEALRVNRTLVQLYLTMNEIGDEGAKAIAGALKDNCSIVDLDLSLNDFEDEGVAAIAEALKANCTIEIISFRCTDFFLNAIEKETEINACIAKELKQQIVTDTQCKTMALGFYQKVPIYILLDIHELVVILDLECKKNCSSDLFSKLFAKNVSEKRLLRMMDEMNRQFNRLLI